MIPTALMVAWLLSSVGCSIVRMELDPVLPSCHAIPPDAPPVRWIVPFDADDRRNLLAWCEPVGPVAHHDLGITPAEDSRPLIIVSWNMAVGNGSLMDLVDDIRRSQTGPPDPHLILLLQEAYRTNDVPEDCRPHSGVTRRLGPRRESASADILELARRIPMYAVYVPSMRNGSDCTAEPREDRGNAILSTLPLSDVVAIEMPFAQQRRVAVAATIRDGSRVLTVVSVHFDTVRGHGRHAQALWETVQTLAWQEGVVIGGDFNARFLDPGVREMKKNFTESDCGTGPTHENGMRLDRMFTRGLAESLRCYRGSQRFGSDHYPLLAHVQPPD